MFDFLLEILDKNKIKKEVSVLYISKDFYNFLKDNNIFIKNEFNSDICYIEISDKKGYIKFLPTSKYFKILKKYKERNRLDNDWYNKMKNNFSKFYEICDDEYIFNKNINNMRFGKWIRRYFQLEPQEVEKLVNKYKNYQNLYISSNQ